MSIEKFNNEKTGSYADKKTKYFILSILAEARNLMNNIYFFAADADYVSQRLCLSSRWHSTC